MKLEDMTCVVTGASGGTGPAIVKELRKRCRAVVRVTRGMEVEWRELTESSKLPGRNGRYGLFEATANVLNQTSVGFLVSEILRHLDQFHAWINVVGGFIMGSAVEDTESDDWPRMFDLNLISALNCCHKILPILKAQEFGRIINFGSIAGIDGMALASPYAVSKAAVINLTRTIALEGKENNVTANVLVPEIIDTPVNRKAMPEADYSKWTRPETVARTIVSLIESDRTGEIVRV